MFLENMLVASGVLDEQHRQIFDQIAERSLVARIGHVEKANSAALVKVLGDVDSDRVDFGLDIFVGIVRKDDPAVRAIVDISHRPEKSV